MEELYRIKTEGHAEDAAIIQGEKYRFTVLTEEMIRLEYCEDGQFEDRATQCVIDRKFKVPEYQVIENEESLEIITDKIHLVYNKQKFTDYGLSVQVRGNISVYHSISEKRQQISEEQQERWMKQMVRLSWSMESSQDLVMEF